MQVEIQQSRLERLAIPLVAITPVLAIVSSRALVPNFAALVLLLLLATWQNRRHWNLTPGFALPLVALVAWAGVTVLWSFPESAPLGRWVETAGLLLAGLLSLAMAPAISRNGAEALPLWLGLGLAVALAILLVERSFGSPLMTWLHGPFPERDAALSRLNRAASLAVLLSWVVALRFRSRWSRLLPPLAVLLVLVPMISGTSRLGMICGLAMALLAFTWPRLARPTLLTGTALVLLCSPLVVLQLQAWGLEEADWLPNTARYRVQIWAFAAERIFEQPWSGWGFAASRSMPNFGEVSIMGVASVIPLHPHSIPLHAWLELGLPGPLLLFALLWFALRSVERLDQAIKPLAYGLAGSLVGLSLTGYGLWQSNTLTLAFIPLCYFAIAQKSRSDRPQPDSNQASSR